jgi:hypothetical protein
MKPIVVFSVLLLLITSCNEEQVEQVKITDPAEHNMKFIPQNPGGNDEIKLVIYDDCNYNILSGIKQNGKIIDIEKKFNSMMKWPCMMRNDTILIGKLPEGTYRINYILIDIANQALPKITLSFTFNLVVSG